MTHQFKPGDRVEWNEAKSDLTCERTDNFVTGEFVESGRNSLIRRDDGKSYREDGNWAISPLSILRPATPADAQVEMSTECAACGKMHVGGRRKSKKGLDWDGKLASSRFDGAPLCDGCYCSRGIDDVEADIRSRGGWPRPPNPAPVEEWQPRVGDEVERFVPETGAVSYSGKIIGITSEARIESPGGVRRSAPLGCIRPARVSEPAKNATVDLRESVKVGDWVEWHSEGFGLMRGQRIFRRDHFTVRYSGVECTSIVNHECGWKDGVPLPPSMRRVEQPERTGDPYRSTTLTGPEALKRAAWGMEQDEIHARKVQRDLLKRQQAAAQLNAKLPAHPKTWPSAWSTSTYESDW